MRYSGPGVLYFPSRFFFLRSEFSQILSFDTIVLEFLFGIRHEGSLESIHYFFSSPRGISIVVRVFDMDNEFFRIQDSRYRDAGKVGHINYSSHFDLIAPSIRRAYLLLKLKILFIVITIIRFWLKLY